MELLAARALRFNEARTTQKFHLLLCALYIIISTVFKRHSSQIYDTCMQWVVIQGSATL